ncbi:hypothetical protein J3E69DRAFT_330487 [Trichoderma sp. SZMC 28015]
METVNSQISASHQSATDTRNSIGPYRSGPPRGRRRPRKSRPSQRLDLSQPKVSRKPRKPQKDQNTDAPTDNASVIEFSIDGLYPKDDVTYPPPPILLSCQIPTEELPADIVSPRTRDGIHNRLPSIREDQSLCPLQEDNKHDNLKRIPHALPDESEHKIHSKGPPPEPNLRDRRATKSIHYNNEQVLRHFFPTSMLPISPPMSRDPSSSTHHTVEQNIDEVEVPRAETVFEVSETRSQVIEPMSDMHGGHIVVGIEGEANQERGVILPVPQRSESPLVKPLSQIISETRPPTYNAKLNKSSGNVPVSWAFEPIGGPWRDQEHHMFLEFEMWP